ncbi:MAG TPA: efflux RND transporter periplasmic adaptor subunit [Candidatus Baltobacteraceae bacterium]|jgi:HlyD family secretion protein
MSARILSTPGPVSIESVIGRVRPHLTRKRILAGIAIIAIASLAIVVSALRARTAAPTTTAPVVSQTLVQTVSASGTVTPQNTISVGTQVSGTIASLYVDYNSKVHKGEVLAKIDPSTLQAQLSQAEASLAQARAQAAAASQNAVGAQAGASAANASITVAQANSAAAQQNARSQQEAIATADANVAKEQSALALAQQTVSRDNALLSQGYIAQSQADTDRSNAVAAASAVKAAQVAAQQARTQAAAGVSQAQASAAQSVAQSSQSMQSAAQAAGSSDTAQAASAAVSVAQAQVQQDQLNVQRTVITSPVNGTVIARSVSVGQTVAASLQTPTLFTIAQDQSKMEVDIAVGEPDIGSVKTGNPVSFSVLAYPNQTFNGTVSQVRENPTTVNNVVTYTVITFVKNTGNKLLPGMTANATIQVASKSGLVVPLQALQYQPSGGRHHSNDATAAAGSPWGQTSGGAGTAIVAGRNGTVYVQDGNGSKAVNVRVDLVSGTQAAVTPTNGALVAGQQLVLSDGAHQSKASRPASGGPAGASPQKGGGTRGLGRAL